MRDHQVERWGVEQSDPSPVSRRLLVIRTLRLTLLALLTLFAVSLAVTGTPGTPIGPLSTLLYVVTCLCAVVACLVPADTDRASVWAWRLVGLWSLLIVTSAVLVAVPWITQGRSDYPAVADWIAVLAYPLMYAAAMMLVTAQVRHLDLGAWLDGLIVALGIAAVTSAVMPAPAGGAPSLVAMSNIILVGRPVIDVALLIAVTGAILTLRLSPSPGLQLLLVTVALRFVGDSTRLAMDAGWATATEAVVSVLWLASVALAGIAAGVPNKPRAARATPGSHGSAHWRGLALPSAAALGSLLVLTATQQWTLPGDASVLAILTLTLVLARTALTIHDVLSLSDVHTQARTDDLTGLPNRRALYERADALLGRRAAHSRESERDRRSRGSEPRRSVLDGPGPISMVIVDLDRFKEINDSLGHPTGDALLVQVGARLRTLVRDGDVLARLGGDEFAILLPSTDSTAAVELARSVLKGFLDPFPLGSLRLHVDASIGVATTPSSGGSRPELLRCADVAMYDAKQSREGVVLYVPLDCKTASYGLRLAEDLRSTLEGGPHPVGELVVHLQPQISLPDAAAGTWKVTGIESLVRWEHPEHGCLLPEEFLPLAESAGLLRQVGYVVAARALDACQSWWELGYHVPVSLNLSGRDMHDDALPERVRDALDKRGLPATALVIEVTEHHLMFDAERVRPVLDRLRESGVGISIDDYGTGFSSLAYLRRLPVDELKLDRLFVSDITRDATSAAIVRHTVGLARSLGLRLVAEGIEDQEACDELTRMGCGIGQGFHFARPMPVVELIAWLRKVLPDPTGARREEGPLLRAPVGPYGGA